jgi:hypothetical protein
LLIAPAHAAGVGAVASTANGEDSLSRIRSIHGQTPEALVKEPSLRRDAALIKAIERKKQLKHQDLNRR